MKFLVCGDTGFIGSNTCKSLLAQGHDVLGISRSAFKEWNHEVCDIANDDFSKLKSIVNNFEPEVIIHLASYPIVRNFSYEAGLDTVVTHKLLDATNKECKFVYGSSIAVYGNNIRYGGNNVTDKLSPVSLYGHTKAHCENLIKLYTTTYNKIKNYSILRLCGNIGDPNKGVVHDIIKKIQGTDKNLELFGDKRISKPYIHIEDTIECIIKQSLSKTENLSHTYNIAPDDTLTSLELATLIMENMGIFKQK